MTDTQHKPNAASHVILPPACLGVIGGGQLGRMFVESAKRMGYKTIVLTPEENGPASQAADETIVAPYDDPAALETLAQKAQAVTIEFENIPSAVLEFLEARLPVRPGSHVLHTTQHRLREKRFLKSNGFPTVAFEEVETLAGLTEALKKIGTPAVLKTAGFGYDGKGQAKIDDANQATQAFHAIGGQNAILEAWIDYVAEFSVIGVRAANGEFCAYGPVENRHKNHILDMTLSPPELALSLQQQTAAVALSREISEALGVVGILTVELFLKKDGHWLVNELAPRPHNSGHYTIDACRFSQFDQQVLTLCGQPLCSIEQPYKAIMLNLLGDWWFPCNTPKNAQESVTPNWRNLDATPNARLHLYGKHEARPGRKMGHITFLGNMTPEEALAARAAIITHAESASAGA